MPPDISIVILNYNGARWLERCLASLREQTIFARTEVIIADNLSTDGSDVLAQRLLDGWPNGKFLQNGANLGFCEGNNRGAALATGRYLFFLNNDTWLEPDCLAQLLTEAEKAGAKMATPIIFDYDDDTIQSPGGAGFDVFGLLSHARFKPETYEVFVCGGCSFFIERELFLRVGLFDSTLFLYADEYDLSWRVWIAGEKGVVVPSARLHHRGAANVNPKGENKMVESRTSDSKRFYTNRNNLLVVLKNCQHFLLLMLPLQVALLAAEALVMGLVVRRWGFIRRAYLEAAVQCWSLRDHVHRERARIAGIRKRSDFNLLRFLCWRLNRWDYLVIARKHGLPKVNPH